MAECFDALSKDRMLKTSAVASHLWPRLKVSEIHKRVAGGSPCALSIP